MEGSCKISDMDWLSSRKDTWIEQCSINLAYQLISITVPVIMTREY
jgi:hypothetical protein